MTTICNICGARAAERSEPMRSVLWRWWKKPRTITVNGTVYRWSLLDRPRCRELRVFREDRKQPDICLRLTYPECWAIDLFRPRVAACVIGWYEGGGRERSGPLCLRGEPALLEGLLDLSFSPEEQAEREQFLEWIQTDGPPPCKWEY